MNRNQTRINHNDEPLALKVLKLPKFMFEKIFNLTLSIILLPSKILFSIFETYIISPKFADMRYYRSNALQRGLISTVIFTLYAIAIFSPLILAAIWDFGSKNVSEKTGINLLGIHKSILKTFSNLLSLIPIFKGYIGILLSFIERELQNETYGDATTLSYRTRIAIYGVTTLIPLYIIGDHVKDSGLKSFSLAQNDECYSEKLNLASPSPQKRLIFTGILTVYFFEDLASILLTLILLFTCFRYKHIGKLTDSQLSGNRRIYFKIAAKNTGILLLHFIAMIFLFIAYVVDTRMKTEYKNIKKNSDGEDIEYLINCIYLGAVSLIDIFYLTLLFLVWTPTLFFNLFTYKGLKTYVYTLKWIERLKFLLKFVIMNFFVWSTLILMFPFWNVSWKIFMIYRKEKFSAYQRDGDRVLEKSYDLIMSYWGNLKLRFILVKSFFCPNRFIYFCKYYQLSLNNGVSIREFDQSYSQARIFEETREETNDEMQEGGVEEMNNLQERRRNLMEIEREIEDKINEIKFSTALKTVIRELSNHMEEKKTKVTLNEVEKYIDESHCYKNFQLLSEFLEEDLWKSFLMFFACILNPISGLQLIYFSYKKRSCSYREIKDLNNQIGELYPLIFFDIIAFVLTPICFPISLLIHLKGNLNIFSVLFFGAKPKYGEQIWDDMRESNIFFFKIWKLLLLTLYQCFNSFMYILFIGVFLVNPKIHQKFRKFRSDHWFNMSVIRIASRKMRVVCWKRMNGKFKLWFYKFEEEDHKIVDDVTKLIDNGFWNQRHTLWNLYDQKGELDKNVLDSLEDDEKTYDDLSMKRDLIKYNCEIGEFEKKLIDGIYLKEAEFLLKYALLKRIEKWMMRLLKQGKYEVPKFDPEDAKGLTTEEEISAEIYFHNLKQRTIHAAENYILFKLKFMKLVLTLVSATLLWRALDMKKFLNIDLVKNIEKELKETEGKSPSLAATYWTLYKLCWKNMWKDILYYWTVFIVLRIDKVCWDMCSKKVAELEIKNIPIYEEEKENEEDVAQEGKANSTVNHEMQENQPETEKVEVEKNIIGYQEIPTLDSIPNIKIYITKRNKIMNQYAKYALNEQLQKIMYFLGKIFPHREEMITKIQTLKRIPQLQNIDSRTANVLVVMILLQDLKIIFWLSISFIINPLRIYSFWVYAVKSDRFKNEINPVVDFNRFQSYENIKAIAVMKAKEFMQRTRSVILFDILFYLKSALFMFFPLRFFSYLRVFLLVRLKLRNKRKGDDLEFNDLKFRDKINARLAEILVEVKHDISSIFSIFVIVVGVFEIKSTWRRIKVLVKFGFKQTIVYRILKTMRGMTFADWIEALGFWWVLGKFGITKEKIFGKEEEAEHDYKRRVLFKQIGWKNMLELGDYLTMKDRMVLCTVNKSTRKFYMENSVLWLHYYKTNIQTNVYEIESYSDISYSCLAHYRKIIAEKNISTERDFNLGIRYILKEQAIKSIISFPDLIATPYKVVNVVCDKIGIEYVSPNGYVTKHRDDAQRYYDEEDRLRVDPRVRRAGRRIFYCLPKYPSTFQNNFNAATGGNTTKMEEIPRIKGFLYLERFFYSVVLFLGGVNAYYRSLFFYKVHFEEGVSFSNAIINFFKALLQLVYCASIVYFCYLYIRFEMSLGCDLITALIGPFCINLLLGFHLMKEVRNNPTLHKEDLDPRILGKCFKNFFYIIYRVTAYPIFKFIYFLVTKFFAKQLIPTIKNIILGTLEIYESTLRFPTELLLGKGMFFEIIHLVIVLVWVLWPQTFIWGFLSFETFYFFPVLKSTFGIIVAFIGETLKILNHGTWFTSSVSRVIGFFTWIWSYIIAFPGFGWIATGYSFLKRIWVLGFFIRTIEKLIFGTTGLVYSILVFILVTAQLYLYEKFVLGVLLEKEDTGGSMVPKILLSLVVLGFKIIRAMKVIKEVQNGERMRVVDEGRVRN